MMFGAVALIYGITIVMVRCRRHSAVDGSASPCSVLGHDQRRHPYDADPLETTDDMRGRVAP